MLAQHEPMNGRANQLGVQLTPPSNALRAALAVLVGLLAGLALLGAPMRASATSAPPDSTATAGDDAGSATGAGSGDTSPTDTYVTGKLSTVDEEGNKVPVVGAEMIVSDAAGAEVGRAVTDADGAWSLPLPTGGDYETLLNVDTLPAGVTLRNPDNNPLKFSVQTGNTRPNLFPLGASTTTTGSSSEIRAVQLFVDGLKYGLLIAMGAIGISLIYGTTRLVNFAHGEIVTFGALVAYFFNTKFLHLPLVLAALLSVVICGAAGALFNQGVWFPLRRRGASLIAAMVVSIGFSILLRNMFLYFVGGGAVYYNDYRIQTNRINFIWFSLVPKDLVIMILSTLILIGVALGLQKTKAGKAMRAVADNRDLAASSGIDVEQVIRWVWIVGSALAGLGGIMLGVTESIGFEMGFRTLLLMFAGVTLGGLGTAYGAMFGSIVIGVFIQMSTLLPFWPTELKNVGALMIMIIILLVRPQGLFGRPERIG